MESFPENFGSEFSRRRFLGSSIGGIQWASLALSAEGTGLQSGLRVWVDTLMRPEDPHPGAGDLGVHLAIEKFSESTHYYPELLRRGTACADHQAGEAKRFAILYEPERVKIVASAEESELMSVPWIADLESLGCFFFRFEATGILWKRQVVHGREMQEIHDRGDRHSDFGDPEPGAVASGFVF